MYHDHLPLRSLDQHYLLRSALLQVGKLGNLSILRGTVRSRMSEFLSECKVLDLDHGSANEIFRCTSYTLSYHGTACCVPRQVDFEYTDLCSVPGGCAAVRAIIKLVSFHIARTIGR